jgi:hypothetical protein
VGRNVSGISCGSADTAAVWAPNSEWRFRGTDVPVNQVAGVTNPTTVALDSGAVAAPSSSQGSADPQQTAKQQTPQPANGQSPAAPSDQALTGNLFNRLAQFYSQDWAGTNPAGPSVTKRNLPAALNSPPFPFSDWTYGGAPDIGAPDGNTYPSMSALNLESSRTKIYGWVAGSLNFSTSAQNNFPV